MKQAYTHLALKAGATKKGIVLVKILPKEWLEEDVVIDFATGNITTALNIIAGRDFIELQFAPNTYNLAEKPKANKSGSYYECTVSGTLNNLDATNRQVMESIRHHEYIVLAQDKSGDIKLFGNKTNGMVLTIDNKTNNSSQLIDVMLAMECENTAPFYTI